MKKYSIILALMLGCAGLIYLFGWYAVGAIGVLALAVMGYLVYALWPGVIFITELFVYLFTKRRKK